MKTLIGPKLKTECFILTLLFFSFSFETSYAAGSKKMFSLNNTDFVFFISFLIFVGVLIYFKVPSIIAKFLDKRSDDIKNEIENASEILEEAKQILSSIETDHIKTTETIERMVITAKDRAKDEEEKLKNILKN